MARYEHRPLGAEERLAALQRCGLGCADRAEAIQILQHLDGHLFAEYCTLLAPPGASGYRFLSGVSYEDALALYRFDSALRTLLLDAIQSIEVSLRSQWAHHPSVAHGPLFYTQPQHFKADFAGDSPRGWNHGQACARLLGICRASKDPLVQRAVEAHEQIPAWVVAEVMSLGQLVSWYSNLEDLDVREGISRTYGLSEELLCSFLPCLIAIRNICAHHGQLCGRAIPVYPRVPQESADLRESYGERNDGRVYNLLVFIAYLLSQIEDRAHHRFVAGLLRLLDEHESADSRLLGFPPQWQRKPVWRL